MKDRSFYFYASASSREALADRSTGRTYMQQNNYEFTYNKNIHAPLAFGYFDKNGKEPDFFKVLLKASLEGHQCTIS